MKNRCKGIMEFHRIYLLITVVLSGLVAARAQVALIR